jgi:hypothetical protein
MYSQRFLIILLFTVYRSPDILRTRQVFLPMYTYPVHVFSFPPVTPPQLHWPTRWA